MRDRLHRASVWRHPVKTESQPWQYEAIGSSTRIAAENRFPNWYGGARTRDFAATPRSITPDDMADSRFGSAASSAMSTRTRNVRSPVQTGRQPTGRRRARSTWSVCVLRPSTCVGYGIAGMRNHGGSPSLLTAARSTNSRSFPLDNSSVHRKTLSKYQRACTCSEWASVERDVEISTRLQPAQIPSSTCSRSGRSRVVSTLDRSRSSREPEIQNRR
jgi:hypothetical protein